MFAVVKSFLRGRSTGNITYVPRRRPSSVRPQLESMEDRSLPSVTLPTAGTPGPVVITGQDGADQFRIQLQPGSSTNIQFSDNGGQSYSTAALLDVTTVTVEGLRGRDALTIDQSNGLVAKIGGLSINFNGGSGNNTLTVTGNPGESVVEFFTAGPDIRSGALTFGTATAFGTVNMTEVSAVFDSSVAANLTINQGLETQLIDISQGRSLEGQASIRVRGPNLDSVNGIVDDRRDTFIADDDQFNSDDDENSPVTDDQLNDGTGSMPITFTNKTNVTVNGFAGSQFFLVNAKTGAAGLQTLTLDGGADFDAVGQQNLPAGVNLVQQNIERVDTTNLTILIDRLYITHLGRLPSQSELDGWVNVAQTAGTIVVVRGVQNSEEAFTEKVRDWYVHFLGREPGNGEERIWVEDLMDGDRESFVMANIVGSGEFANRAQSISQTGDTNRNTVAAMYQVLLNRTASSAEIDGWVSTQFGPRALALAFIASAEFRDQNVGSFYANLLNRNSDFEGRDGWVRSDRELGDIREAFADSLEFFGD